MVSTLNTRTSVQGRISLSEGSIFNAEFDLPEEKMDVISVKWVFSTSVDVTWQDKYMVIAELYSKHVEIILKLQNNMKYSMQISANAVILTKGYRFFVY